MAYYKWVGVDLKGKTCSGVLFAQHPQEVNALLFKRDVGLMIAKAIKRPFLFASTRNAFKMKTISYLAHLLQAEIRLYQALSIITATTGNHYFKVVLEDIIKSIGQGRSLNEALADHDSIFDKITITVVCVGQEAGKLAHVLGMLVHHFEMIQSLKNKLRMSLVIPGVTCCFFFILSTVIFLFIIPRFAFFFESFSEPLPATTRFILACSRWAWTGYALCALIICNLLFAALCAYAKSRWGKKKLDALLLKVPILSSLVIDLARAHFFQMLGLLLQSGVHVTQALAVARESIKNHKINQAIEHVMRDIIAGKSLSIALHEHPFFISAELEALITVGEATGDLGHLIKKAGELCQERVYERLHQYVLIVQPLLLVILGVVIMGVLFALYVPIFTLSRLF